MEIDHIFIFTHTPQEAAQRLRHFGLNEGSANQHPGQGTSCRRFFFENAYLELVWVSNEEEIKNPAIVKTRFWERAHSNESGYSPFGICFRKTSSNEQDLFVEAWQYAPSFVPRGQYACIAPNDAFPWEPMLFEFPFHQIKPLDYPWERKQPLIHPKGFKQITRAEFTLPTSLSLSDSLKKVISHSSIQIVEGHSYHVNIEFDYGVEGARENFLDALPLTFNW
jgi:hypothetical protein